MLYISFIKNIRHIMPYKLVFYININIINIIDIINTNVFYSIFNYYFIYIIYNNDIIIN